jgi:hypothetical protein
MPFGYKLFKSFKSLLQSIKRGNSNPKNKKKSTRTLKKQRSVKRMEPAPADEPVVQICPICLELMNDKSLLQTLPCGHTFHKECKEQLERADFKTCPLCRQYFVKLNMLEELRAKMEDANQLSDMLNDEREVALKNFQDFVDNNPLARPNNSPKLNQLFEIWKSADYAAEQAMLKADSAGREFQRYNNEFYAIRD